MIHAAPAFLAAGGNRHPSAAAWDPISGYLAYGADCNVALWEPLASPEPDRTTGVSALLAGHGAPVNAVCWVRPQGETSQALLVTGSADGELRVWNGEQWTSIAAVLTQHTKSVNAITTVHGSSIFISASADSTLAIWQVSQASQAKPVDVVLLQQIKLNPSYIPLTACVSLLPSNDSYVLAVAGTRTYIQIYKSSSADIDFSLATTLTGHDNWIRSVSFTVDTTDDSTDLILASASQDKYIRLWRFHRGQDTQQQANPLLSSVDSLSLSNKAYRFTTFDQISYSITFEALLLGHEDWIFTAQWSRAKGSNRLLSASADNSLAIWELESTSGTWIPTVRLGEISAQKGATTATGSTGGFWIGLWSADGKAVTSLGRTGSWRTWTYNPQSDVWEQQTAVTGHTRQVQGLAWAKDGSYLLTTGADQTTRMYAEWRQSNDQNPQADLHDWHEISRAQIHGYDLNCLASITPTQFVSGADEKLLRVFDQPNAVSELLHTLSRLTPSETTSKRPDVASIPVLGLSNKAIEAVPEDQDGVEEGERIETSQTTPIVHPSPTRPPTEDMLARHLLWPEIEKLYGHGHEISCVASSRSGKIIATACRASSIDHAVIRLYDTSTWREIKPSLTAHSLTVTALSFSPNDNFLLSVGRDRSFSLFERVMQAGEEAFVFQQKNEKAHSRMVLDCAWLPEQAGTAFATSGRDKAVRIWRVVPGAPAECVASILATGPVTALAVQDSGLVQSSAVLLAYGLEDGSVFVASLDASTLKLHGDAYAVPVLLHPAKSVTEMKWRPNSPSAGEQLAITSEDSSIRILSIIAS